MRVCDFIIKYAILIPMKNNLKLLQNALHEHGLDGFMLPVNDEFMGEYIPDSAKRLEFITGFSGSAGMAVILKDKAAFFTDGRYTLQAEKQITGIELFNSVDMSPDKWVSESVEAGKIIGYDPKLHTLNAIRRCEQIASNVTWKPIEPNPVDALWKDRPRVPKSAVSIQPLEYAGEESSKKRQRIANIISKTSADAVVLTAPDSICWLLNIRGNDVPFTPFLLCYAILLKSGEVLITMRKAEMEK